MKGLIFTLLMLSSAGVYAGGMNVSQSNIGDVTAKLESSHLINSFVDNSAHGNLAALNEGCNINHAKNTAKIRQSNVGNITSDLSFKNFTNQVVQQQVAGTLAVVN